jgi:hypothetical protein
MAAPAHGPVEQPLGTGAEDCPACGATARPGQAYCLECGARLPEPLAPGGAGTAGRLRSGARESLFTVLVALVVAVLAASAVVAVQLTGGDGEEGLLVPTVPAPVAGEEPPEPALPAEEPADDPAAAPPPEEEPPPAAGDEVEAEPGAEPQQLELLSWPEAFEGWTVILANYPEGGGREQPESRGHEALEAGLPEVGVLASGGFSSLQPGYLVVFSGIYESQVEAEATVSAARDAGFEGAYARQIMP